MGWVPQPLLCGAVWEAGKALYEAQSKWSQGNGPTVVELYGRKALYGARSGAIPIWVRSSSPALCGMRTRKSTMAGPGKEAAAICGAFVRHTPRFHHWTEKLANFLLAHSFVGLRQSFKIQFSSKSPKMGKKSGQMAQKIFDIWTFNKNIWHSIL